MRVSKEARQDGRKRPADRRDFKTRDGRGPEKEREEGKEGKRGAARSEGGEEDKGKRGKSGSLFAPATRLKNVQILLCNRGEE